LKEVPVSKGKYTALVDDEDYSRVMKHKWHRFTTKEKKVAYAATHVINKDGKRKRIFMHRFIFEHKEGSPQLSHKDQNGFNNQRSNLGSLTFSENKAIAGLRSCNTTGYKGIYLENIRFKWCARIKKGGKSYFLGYYEYIEDAARAYNKKAKELFGEFAYQNVILKEEENV